MEEKKSITERIRESRAGREENGREKRRLRTLKAEQKVRERDQKLKEKESKRAIREKKGGMGMSVTLWDIAPPTTVRRSGKGKR